MVVAVEETAAGGCPEVVAHAVLDQQDGLAVQGIQAVVKQTGLRLPGSEVQPHHHDVVEHPVDWLAVQDIQPVGQQAGHW